MNNELRDRADKYAQLYSETSTLREFKKRVEAEIGKAFLDEAEVAWEAVDQWEGTYRPINPQEVDCG